MTIWQIYVLGLFAFANIGIALKGFQETIQNKNAYGLTPTLMPLGIFVWGDAIIFGWFWVGVSLVSLVLKDWLLFLLIYSLFWLVRSLGETIYWFNQQFSTLNRNDPKKHWSYRYLKNDSMWFLFQITHQCLTVITIITSLYLAKIWLAQF